MGVIVGSDVGVWEINGEDVDCGVEMVVAVQLEKKLDKIIKKIKRKSGNLFLLTIFPSYVYALIDLLKKLH
jgi:hypothetical protein